MTFRFDITDAEFSEYMKHFYKKRFSFSPKIWIYVAIAILLLVFSSYYFSNKQGDGENSSSMMQSLISWLLLLGIMAGVWFLIMRTIFKNIKIKPEKETKSKANYWIYGLIAVVLIGINTYTWNNSKAETSTDSSPYYVQSLLSWLVLFGLIGGSWFFLIRRITTISHIKPEDRETLLGEREMTFNENKIEYKNNTAESTYRWEAIKKWEQTTHLYLLFIMDNSAIILPKRVFENAAQQSEFEQLIRRKLPNLTSDKYLDA
jgi:protein-S-isoprenylcysteine O-methyltransferase Ste14